VGDIKVPKLRPTKGNIRNTKHGLYTLGELLKGDIDGRLAIAKKRDALQAQWVDHCGGLGRLSPGMLSLVQRIVHQELLISHAEKMALIGLYEPDKTMQARINSQRLNILALEGMIANNRGREEIPTIREIIDAESK
jgi:hypothetical protein